MTVVICAYQRWYNVEKIVWNFRQSDPDVPIILWRNGENRRHCPYDSVIDDVMYFSCNRNCGPMARFAAARFAQTEAVLFWDDDMIPTANALKEWRRRAPLVNDAVIGVFGRRWNENPPTYYGHVANTLITPPARTLSDYVGGAGMLCSRELVVRSELAELTINDPAYWVEDLALSVEAVEHGYELVIDTELSYFFWWSGQSAGSLASSLGKDSKEKAFEFIVPSDWINAELRDDAGILARLPAPAGHDVQESAIDYYTRMRTNGALQASAANRS